jgi:hypothetical protein
VSRPGRLTWTCGWLGLPGLPGLLLLLLLLGLLLGLLLRARVCMCVCVCTGWLCAQVCTVRTRWTAAGLRAGAANMQQGQQGGEGGSAEEALNFGCALNTRLPHDIGVRHAELVEMGWAPFRGARKRYRYLITAAAAVATEEDPEADHGRGEEDGAGRGRRQPPPPPGGRGGGGIGLSKRPLGRQYHLRNISMAIEILG